MDEPTRHGFDRRWRRFLAASVAVERRVEHPMLDLVLLRNRTFATGNLASLLASIGRGGLLSS
jgi:hypothetical protein